jgi:hypothetical protein
VWGASATRGREKALSFAAAADQAVLPAGCSAQFADQARPPAAAAWMAENARSGVNAKAKDTP